jgi:hypothetical protein
LLRDRAPTSTRFRLGHRAKAVVDTLADDSRLSLRRVERFADWTRAQARDAELVYGLAYYGAALLAERSGPDAALAVLRAQRGGQDLETAFRAVTGTPTDAFYAAAIDFTRARSPADALGDEAAAARSTP